MYLVAEVTGDMFEPMIVPVDDGTKKAVPFFTEKLHAERFRDVNWPEAKLEPITTREALAAYAQQIKRYYGVDYVAIDPHPEAGKPAVIIPIDEI